MTSIAASPLPDASLLQPYVRDGGFTDCYVTDVAGQVSHARYVEAFYTTPLFRVERFILRWAAASPSSDRDAREMAQGRSDSFAAWQVEGRRENQVILAAGRTRSWLMVVPASSGGQPATRLYFGSAIVPARRVGRIKMGLLFTALLGFHKLYSRALLRAARSRLENSGER